MDQNLAETTSLEARLDRIAADVAFLADRQRRQAELIEELTPVMKQAMAVATTNLAELERKGYFRFGKAALSVADRVVGEYGEEDLADFARNVVNILDTFRELTQPEVLAVVREATEVVEHRDSVEPLGVIGLVRAAGDAEVQRGMSVLMELLRHLGRAADRMAARQAAPPARKVVPGLAPRRRAAGDRPRPTGVERPAKRVEPSPPAEAAASCAAPRPPGPAVTTLDGVGFTADGFVADPQQWTRELGEAIARAAGLEMTEAHWALVDFARRDWEATGVSPNIRRLSTGTGVATRDIYALFKKAPGKTIARIAGIPKPAGCI